jgi:hypothetical protein
LAVSCFIPAAQDFSERRLESGSGPLGCLLDRLVPWLSRLRPGCFAAPCSWAGAVRRVRLAVLAAPLPALSAVLEAP